MEELYYPNRAEAKNARIKNICEYNELVTQATEDFEGYWDKLAKEKISWFQPYSQVLDESNAPFYKWFVGGKLNASYQCIDRHLDTRKNKSAIIFEGELGDKQIITYRELYHRVNKTANLLKNKFGVKKGDRVVIYMPMIPEAAISMLACARIGAIHSVVFGGFSAEALRDRIVDAEAKVVMTADGAYRRGKPYLLKPLVDEALSQKCESVKAVVIVERNGADIKWVAGRDFAYAELVEHESPFCEPEIMDSEDNLKNS